MTVLLVATGSFVALAAAVAASGLFYLGADRPKRYERRVGELEKRLMAPAPQGVVLLAGSSFFDNWTTSGRDLEPLHTVNVGIGGTKIGDQLAYLDRLVLPFDPRALLLYAGSNDISGIPFFSKTADQVVPKIKEYVDRVHRARPELPIYYVAITETPSRARVRGEIQKANRLLSEWARETGEITFIDTAPALLTAEGGIDGSLFGPDRLHFNEAGYRKFAAAIRDVVIPELAGE